MTKPRPCVKTMLCDVELRNCHQSIMVQAERVKFLDAITNPCRVDPRNVPVVNFGHCENRGLGDKMLVEFERFAVYSVRVWSCPKTVLLKILIYLEESRFKQEFYD